MSNQEKATAYWKENLRYLLILLSIYLIRFAYLLIFKKDHVLPEGFVSPRGLISILLYYNLPPSLKLPEISTAFLFVVVLGSSLVMSIGLLTSKKGKSTDAVLEP